MSASIMAPWQVGLTLMALLALPGTGSAFPFCDQLTLPPAELADRIRSQIVSRTPVKYRAVVDRVQLRVQPSHSEFPYAKEEEAGVRVIYVDPKFAKATCEIATATFLVVAGGPEADFDEAARSAATCFDAHKPDCLPAFAANLSRRYAKAFEAVPEKDHDTIYALHQAALAQVLMHEYAHHLLEHFSKIRASTLARSDAEFEADLFAMTNGFQAGDPVTALHYFFDGVEALENHTNTVITPGYETAKCRRLNVAQISEFSGGFAPLVLLSVSSGGRAVLLRPPSPERVQAIGDAEFGGQAPTLAPEVCGKLAKQSLGGIHQEMKQLYLRVARDADRLLEKDKLLDAPTLGALVRDLTSMARGFRYLSGLAAHSASLVLRRQGLAGGELAPGIPAASPLLDAAGLSGGLLSGDFGRLLQARGLAVLQEGAGLPPEVRLKRAQEDLEKAVYYNPDQSESWMNLALIALKRGRCAEAVPLLKRAADTTTDDEMAEEKIRGFAAQIAELAKDEHACRARAHEMNLYGL